MSQRAHLVIRIVALGVIVATAFLPRAPRPQDAAQEAARVGATAAVSVQ